MYFEFIVYGTNDHIRLIIAWDNIENSHIGYASEYIKRSKIHDYKLIRTNIIMYVTNLCNLNLNHTMLRYMYSLPRSFL